MGYKRNPKVYKLAWQDGGDLDGLEVVVRSVSVGQMMDLKSSGTSDEVTTMMELLAERLVSWNLEDEHGAPVPATLDGVKGEDFDFVMAIVSKWVEAVQGVPAPLESASPAGGTSPAVSIPMESLSPSLAS